MAPNRVHCYAQCAPGLERLTEAELRALGIRTGRRERGGISFEATTRQLYAANLWLRVAGRVLVRIDAFAAPDFGALEAAAARVEWPALLPPGTRPVFRVTSHASHLDHTGAVAQRLEDAVAAAVGLPGRDDAPEQLFVVRNLRDRITLSIDSSGEPLHKRGWRQAVGKAPLRETLAAAMVEASGWVPGAPLVDPFCGSGTIPIEAALIARDLAPGRGRAFAFANWPSFEPGTWASVAGEARRREEEARPRPLHLLGRDRDDGVIAMAVANAERAGVADVVEFRAAAISDLVAPDAGRGWLLTDPPHGRRLRGGDLRNLYARLGDVAREHLAGWHVGLLAGDRTLADHTGLALEPRLETQSGGRAVSLLMARQVA